MGHDILIVAGGLTLILLGVIFAKHIARLLDAGLDVFTCHHDELWHVIDIRDEGYRVQCETCGEKVWVGEDHVGDGEIVS